MGTVNLVKLIELYKEILSTYITENGILIATNDMEDKDILDSIAIKNYIVTVIRVIEEEYIDKGALVVIGVKVDELIRTLQLPFDASYPCLYKTLYTLYNKIIHLQQKG